MLSRVHAKDSGVAIDAAYGVAFERREIVAREIAREGSSQIVRESQDGTAAVHRGHRCLGLFAHLGFGHQQRRVQHQEAVTSEDADELVVDQLLYDRVLSGVLGSN